MVALVVAVVVIEDVRVEVRDEVGVVVAELVAVVVGEVVGVLRWQPENVPSANDSMALFSIPATCVHPVSILMASPIVQAIDALIVPREYLSTAFCSATVVAAQLAALTRVTSPATSGPHLTSLFWWHLAIISLTVWICTLHFCRDGNVRYVTPWLSVQMIRPS